MHTRSPFFWLLLTSSYICPVVSICSPSALIQAASCRPWITKRTFYLFCCSPSTHSPCSGQNLISAPSPSLKSSVSSFPWLLESSPESVMGTTTLPGRSPVLFSPSQPGLQLCWPFLQLRHIMCLPSSCPSYVHLSLIFYLASLLSIFLKAQFKCHYLPFLISSPTLSRAGQVQDSMSQSLNLSVLFPHDTCDIYLCDSLFFAIAQHPEQYLGAQQEEINTCLTARL